MQNFEIQICSLPDREKLVAEIWFGERIIAEINFEKAEMEIEIYYNDKLMFNLNKFIQALETAKKELIAKLFYNFTMKRITLMFILFLSFLGVFGQNTKIYKTKVPYRNAPIKGYREYLNHKGFKLCPLQSSIYQTHIRISFGLQTIDLYSKNGVAFKGILTNYIRAYIYLGENSKDPRKATYYYEKISLAPEKVQLIVEMLYRTQQSTIPTDSLIPDWAPGAIHCDAIFFEYYINKKYNRQHYSCPKSKNDTIIYKKIIQENQHFIEKELELNSLYAGFKNKLPKGKAFYGKPDYSYFITR